MLQAWCDLRHNGGGRWLCAVVSRVYDFTTVFSKQSSEERGDRPSTDMTDGLF